ncbi:MULTISPECIES: helix-turn-helix domain-containing protein [Marinobacter]|uniref:helix-turn-helix domain-containing protein n=1 Tax=Marinobacter TaxID=2742 RepID=UPI001D08D7A9|nr:MULTISPECIES: helix-turn-helix domain-containing protein [Marinobacter]MCK7566452.1 helix-turn-helix domain-containing protein [Marinobacter xestospongiae]UDL06582.1 helix-turn-helix domain-containing protein [Marinobacter sp. CA1]
MLSQDAHRQARYLSRWHQEYDQISPGHFHGRIDELHLGDLQVYRESTSQALRQQCQVWSDSLWIGIPSQHAECRINGQALGRNDLFCRPGDTLFELVTPPEQEILGLVVPRQALQAVAEAQGIALSPAILEHQPRLTLPHNTRQQLSYLIRRLSCADTSQFSGRIHRDLLLTALLEVLAQDTPTPSVAPSYRHRRTVVDTIKAYMDSHDEGPLTVTELCKVACVSRRTLQYSFESILGISPVQFLRVTRLNRVKRRLTAPDTTTVSDAAASQGFYHLSQFAADYKQLFGETPSTTLRNRAIPA